MSDQYQAGQTTLPEHAAEAWRRVVRGSPLRGDHVDEARELEEKYHSAIPMLDRRRHNRPRRKITFVREVEKWSFHGIGGSSGGGGGQ